MIYTGIGSRKTPKIILDMMTELAMLLASQGWFLRSGGANGADVAFETGCDFNAGFKSIYLPESLLIVNDTIILAQKVWDYRRQDIPWSALTKYTQRIMARNCLQVLGPNLNSPSDVIICWTPEGDITGGTGQALSLAKMINENSSNITIPVINLAKEEDRNIINAILKGDNLIEFVNCMKGEILNAKTKSK